MSLTSDRSDVQSYLNMLQGVIARMAQNSASCNPWCVTLVAALLVLAVDKAKPDMILVGLLPLVMFALLDAYYLSLERMFRTKYNEFVARLREETAEARHLFDLAPARRGWRQFPYALACIFSPSVLPFYGVLVAGLIVAKWRISS